MSGGFQYQGRRVADPKPVVRGGMTSDLYGSGLTDLESAWSTMGKAKTAMRRAEHRATDAERPPPFGADSNVGNFSVPVERVPSYTIGDSLLDRGGAVDNYGRTPYMKSKISSSRKVSRMDDKYKEDTEVSHHPRARPDPRPSQPASQHSYTVSGNPLGAYPDYRPRHTDVDSLISARSVITDPSASQRSANLTDSRALRETEVRFLNDDFGSRGLKDTGYGTGARLTHVDVTVPAPYRAAATYPAPGGKYPGHTHRESKESQRVSSARPPYQDVTYTVDDNGSDKKMRRTLRDLDQNEHGLAKVKEMIKRQRLNWSPRDSASDSGEKEQSEDGKRLGSKSQHFDAEPVQPKKYELYDDAERDPAPVRKVAAGPPAPTYKGFNETETRYRSHDGRIVKLSDMKRKVKRNKALEKLEIEKEDSKAARHVPSYDQHEDKPPKPHRVTSSKKKLSKYDHKEIITTSSWRAGQNLVLRELGPPNKPSKSRPPAPLPPGGQDRTGDRSEGDLKSGSAYFEDAKPRELKKSNLSEQAKSVLADLQADHTDSEGEDKKGDVQQQKHDEEKRKSSHRRRQPKGQRTEDKQEKVRHYDSDKVKRYIAKQKALRKHKQQEEKDKEKKAEQTKQKQLEELYRRQKASTRHTRSKSGEVEHRRPRQKEVVFQGGAKTGSQQDRPKPSSGSDKENKGSGHPWSDVSSSDSATLTEGSVADGADTATRDKKEAEQGAQSKQKADHQKSDMDDLVQRYTKPKAAAAMVSDMREVIKNSGVAVEDIMAKYSRQAEVINHRGAAAAPLPGDYASSNSLPPRDPPNGRPYSAFTASSGYRSKAERLQAMLQTSESLKSRLHEETQKITPSAQKPDPAKWAYSARPGDLDGAFVSRYDRLAVKTEDYTVFTSDLPGVRNISETAYRAEEVSTQNQAASRIQAAYRGHSVRQNLSWRVPQHKGVPAHKPRPSARGFNYKDLGLTGLSDDSLASDSTLTEDDFDHRQIGAGLRAVDFCASGHKSTSSDDEFRHVPPPRPARPAQKWGSKPESDPYSVLNVYARKSQYRPVPQPADSYGGLHAPMTSAELLHSIHKPVKSHTTTPPTSDREDLPQPQSRHSVDDVSYQDDFTSAASASLPSRVSQSQSHRSRGSAGVGRDSTVTPTRSKAGSGRSRTSEKSASLKHGEKSDDDTLDGTLTPSKDLVSDREAGGPDSEVAVSQALVPSHHSQSAHTHDDSDLSDLSSLGEGEGRRDPLAHYSRSAGLSGTYMTRTSTGYTAPKMSPANLGQRMSVELNLLDTMEESLRQLTDVDRARAVTSTQQETVSLAQILKARKQEHSHEMLQLQMKAQQESVEASRQLEEARRRAADATQSAAMAIADVRSDGKVQREQTNKFIETQTEAAKATAEAARKLAEIQPAVLNMQTQQEMGRLATETASAAASAAVNASLEQFHRQHMQRGREDHGTQYSRGSVYSSPGMSRTDWSYVSDGYDSTSFSQTPTASKVSKHGQSIATDAAGSESVPTASVVTASDASLGGAGGRRTDSSIHTEPLAANAASPGDSRTDSIQEDITNYSVEFDESSVTEDLEQSMRDVLPYESQRKKLKRETSLNQTDCSFSSDEFQFQLPEPVSSRRLSFEDDSFNRFNTDMVRQYMKEEELRAQHKNTLLKLRESALKEKTQAELAWLEQQKQRIRQKGTDDAYPQIKKRQRGLIMRLQQEQAEIKRLQEANKVASRERQLMLLQSEEIQRIRQSAQKVLAKVGGPLERVKHWLGVIDLRGQFLSSDQSTSVASEQVSQKVKRGSRAAAASVPAADDDLSLHLDDASETRSSSPGKYDKDYKSDSEVYVDSNGGRPPSPDVKVMQKLRKMKLDEKYLTAREQRLRQRRKQLQEMMAWNERLDQEEAKVKRMEAALASMDGSKKTRKEKDALDKSKHKKGEAKEAKALESARTPRTDTSIATETAASEWLSPRSKSGRSTAAADSEVSMATEKQVHSASDSSIPEDISKSESQTDKKTHDSSDDTIVNSSANEEYTNETFESTTEQTRTKTQTQASPKQSPSAASATDAASTETSPRQSRLSKLAKQKGLDMKSPKSPLRSPIKDGRKGSESESDDSLSIAYSETPSDQSDLEGRIRSLNDELRRRQLEAEKLKKAQKKKHKEKLKVQEESLKNQIERYDMYISQMRTEISDPDPDSVRNGVPPVIRQPGDAMESKRRAQKASSPEDSTATTDDTIKPLPSSPAKQQQSSLSSITEDHKETTPAPVAKDTPRDASEISEDIPTDVITAAESEGTLDLRLRLEDSEVDDRGTTPTPRSAAADPRAADTARSLSEIPEEYTHSEPGSVSKDVDEDKSEHSEVSQTSERLRSSRSSYSSASKSYSEDFSSSSTAARSETAVSTKKDDRVTTAEPEDSIAESIQTEGDISDIESDADNKEGELFFDLRENKENTAPSMEELPVRETEASQEPMKESREAQPKENILNELTDDLMQGVLEDSVDAIQNVHDARKAEEVVDSAEKARVSTKKEQASEIAAENLVNEAITQMLNIRKRKKDSVQQTEDLKQVTADKHPRKVRSKDDSDLESALSGGTWDIPEWDHSPRRTGGSTFLADMPPLDGNTSVVSKDQLKNIEDMYKEIEDGEQDEWWEEDELDAVKRPPPPYPDNTTEASVTYSRKDLKLELDRLTEVFYAVPHSEAEATVLAENAVDVFWERRRYGEPWDDVQPPDTYFSPRDKSVDMEGRSRKAYKKLVFDLTAEILLEMYKDEDEEEEDDQPWAKTKPAKRKYHREQVPPMTCDVLKPIVQGHVTKYLGLESKGGSKAGKWTGRRKKDRVDQLLVQELREDEPEWVNYDRDEVAVKMQLADSIFESLLQETVTVVGDIYAKKAAVTGTLVGR